MHSLSWGILTWTTAPRAHVGVFCVWKSNKTAFRLIVDARVPSHLFREPLGVRLLASEGLGRVEVDCGPDGGLADVWQSFFGVTDVKGCFHWMGAASMVCREFMLAP